MMATDTMYYNQDIKEAYIENEFDNEDTIKLQETLFKKTKSTEEFFGRDLATFTLDEIAIAFRNFNPATMNSASNLKSRIKSYIRWAIEHGYRQNNMNPLDGVVGWERQFVDEVTERHLSSERIANIQEELPNFQDVALIQCIFEGVSGVGLSELINMNYSDINFTKKEIHLRNDKGEDRVVKVSNDCLNYLNRAYNESNYVNIISGSETSLIECGERIFKNTRSKNTQYKEISKLTLPKRLARIKDLYELDEFSTNSLTESGQIKMAVDLYKENGKLDKEEFELISDQFKTSRIKYDGYDYVNIHKMRHYITRENIKELYNIDIETL